MSPTDIHKLLKEPFGPYPQSEILNDDWAPNARDWPSLTSLYMTCNGEAVGFDETEYIYTPAQTTRCVFHPVNFFGVLEIKSLSWLSAQGHEWLQQDLRQRDIDMHMQHKEHPTSGLSLKYLYGHRKGEGSTIKVYIQGVKTFNVLFLQPKQPYSLALESAPYLNRTETEQVHRTYGVISLDVETFNLSQNFFLRYRLLGLMNDIIATDPDKTPLEDRDIHYFIDQYINRYRHERLNEQHHRYIFDSDLDSDVDEQGSTTKPRHLRTLHRAEIFGIFTSQATWILAQQLKPQKLQLIDIRKWHKFCRQAIAIRKDARRHGNTHWGRVDSDAEDEVTIDLDRFWVPKNLQKKLHQLSKSSKASKQKSQKASIPSKMPRNQKNCKPLSRHEYDSDFSEPSTPACSDNTCRESTDSEKYKLITFAEYYIPRLPQGAFKWQCPVRTCVYTIDLLDLTKKNVENLPEDYITLLLSRNWKLKDQRIQTAFLQMASNHYDDHNTERGIRWESDPLNPKKKKLVWINAKHHNRQRLGIEAQASPTQAQPPTHSYGLRRSVRHPSRPLTWMTRAGSSQRHSRRLR